jgi:hypothetical protein
MNNHAFIIFKRKKMKKKQLMIKQNNEIYKLLIFFCWFR